MKFKSVQYLLKVDPSGFKGLVTFLCYLNVQLSLAENKKHKMSLVLLSYLSKQLRLLKYFRLFNFRT